MHNIVLVSECSIPVSLISPVMFLPVKLLLCVNLELRRLSFLFFVSFVPPLLNAQYPWLSVDPLNSMKT